MKNVNLPRKYSDIRLAGNSQNSVLGTARHLAVDSHNEALGCTLKTGGEIDLIRLNYDYLSKVAKKNRNILRKVTRCRHDVKTSERPTGTPNTG